MSRLSFAKLLMLVEKEQNQMLDKVADSDYS